MEHKLAEAVAANTPSAVAAAVSVEQPAPISLNESHSNQTATAFGKYNSSLAHEPFAPTVPTGSVRQLIITGTKESTLTNPSEVPNRLAPSRGSAVESLSAASNSAQNYAADQNLPECSDTKSPAPRMGNTRLSEAHPGKDPSAIKDDVEIADEAKEMPSSKPSTVPKEKPTTSNDKRTTERQAFVFDHFLSLRIYISRRI